MAAISSQLKNEKVLRSVFSALGWGTVGVLTILLAWIAEGTIAVDSTRSATVFLGLGAAVGFTLSQLALCDLRSRTVARSQVESHAPGRLTTQPLDYLVSLLNVSRAVGSDVSTLELGQVIVDSCRDSFDCDEVSLMMLEPGGSDLTTTAFAGHRDVSDVRNARVRLGEGVAGTVAQTRVPLILGPDVDTAKFPRFKAKTRKIHSAMIAPIVVRNRVIGVLNASTSNIETFYNEDDLRVLCILAEHAGIVAAKARDTDRVVRLVRRLRARHQQRMTEAGLMQGRDPNRKAA